MDEVKDHLTPLLLAAGTFLIALGITSISVAGYLFLLLGTIAIYAWERVPWSLTSDLSRVCRRLDMGRVDMIYDNDSGKVMVLILSANDEIRKQVDIEVKDNEQA